jgi:hypothetical protein
LLCDTCHLIIRNNILIQNVSIHMYSVDSKISIGLKALFSKLKHLTRPHFYRPIRASSSFPRYSICVSIQPGHHFSCKTSLRSFERSTPNRCSTKPLYPLGTSRPAVISWKQEKYP